MAKGFKKMKKKVTPKGSYILKRGFISALDGRMIGPGDKVTADDLTPGRLAELKDKGLFDSVMTTEEKGTITK